MSPSQNNVNKNKIKKKLFFEKSTNWEEIDQSIKQLDKLGTQEDRDIDDRDIVDETSSMPLLRVDRPLNLCGSCLDFQCHAGNLEEENNAAWAASYFVTGFVTSLFVRATVLGKKIEQVSCFNA